MAEGAGGPVLMASGVTDAGRLRRQARSAGDPGE